MYSQDPEEEPLTKNFRLENMFINQQRGIATPPQNIIKYANTNKPTYDDPVKIIRNQIETTMDGAALEVDGI